MKAYTFLLAFSTLFLFIQSSNYQLWKQCDPQWANIQLGWSSDTICSAGCLMTSVTMAVTSMPTWVNPAGMNQWLKQHGGYISGDLFAWNSIAPLGLHFGGLDGRTEWIVLHLMANHYVIANVDGGNHWVLVTNVGKDGSYINVNDPGYNREVIGMGQVVQYGWYERIKLPIDLIGLKTSLEQVLSLKKLNNLKKYLKEETEQESKI